MTAQAKSEALDPITVEVVRYKLDGIANEMQSTLLRSSFSPIVKEGLDASASLFTSDGTTLSQSCSIPIHLATLIPAVAKVIETYPVDGMRDGDIYILNDPYTGGTHLPDIAVIAAGLSPRPGHCAERRHDPSPGCRRHVGGIGADQRHGDLPGGPADSAAEAARRRRLQRHAGQDDPPERAHPRHGDGRSQCPGRGLHGGGAPAGRARRRLRPQPAGLDLRRAAAALGDDDPQGARRHPRGDLSLRRLPRQ